MIKLLNIKASEDTVTCVAFVEDCPVGVDLVYNVEKKSISHKSLPDGYEWCKHHIWQAKSAIKKMVETGGITKEKTIMWH